MIVAKMLVIRFTVAKICFVMSQFTLLCHLCTVKGLPVVINGAIYTDKAEEKACAV